MNPSTYQRFCALRDKRRAGEEAPEHTEKRAFEIAVLELVTADPMLKTAPVQGYTPGIPWSLHLEAYDVYRKKYGAQHALIEGWCRGGFGTSELDAFVPNWRAKVSEIGRLRSLVSDLERTLAKHARDACWQPIATAPKDRHIIGYWHGYKRPCVMWWNIADEAFESLMDKDEQPSHWIPLPTNPAAAFIEDTTYGN